MTAWSPCSRMLLAGREVTDDVDRHPADLDVIGRGSRDAHPRTAEQRDQSIRVRRGHGDHAGRRRRDELLHGRVGEDAALSDDQQVVGHQFHLAHQVRGQQDGASLRSELGEKGTDPLDPVQVEPVDGLVEDQDARVGEQRGGESQALTHPEGEVARGLARHIAETYHSQHLVDSAGADADRCPEGQQVVARGSALVDTLGIEQSTDLRHRCRRSDVVAAVDQCCPGRRAVEPDHEPHRRGLAGSVGAEEAGHDPWADRGTDAVDGVRVAIVLGEVPKLDHCHPWSTGCVGVRASHHNLPYCGLVRTRPCATRRRVVPAPGRSAGAPGRRRSARPGGAWTHQGWRGRWRRRRSRASSGRPAPE